jgi:metallo-beta-lactamase family protein
MGKVKNKVRVSFVGENSCQVTGSCILVESQNKKILIECGLSQGESSLLKEYQKNNQKFKFKPKEIDYVILLHSHIDHVGLVARLYKEGCKAQIIAPKGLMKLFEVMARDSAFIMQKDAMALTKKFKKEFEPIYEEGDVFNALQYWNECNVNEKVKLDNDIEIRFTSSGHIINACQGEIWIKDNYRTVKIGVTSDLGNNELQQYYVDKFVPIEQADLLIGECTYSDKGRKTTKKNRDKDLEKIETVVTQTCIENKSKILVPVFALQRCQVMLTYLYDIFGDDESFKIPILIDSPLAIKICEIFEEELKGDALVKFKKVMAWKNVKKLKEFSDTQYYCSSEEPCVFLSCSGMLTAGRSIHVASKLLPNPNNHILFCGFSSEISLAGKIKQKKTKTVTIDGVGIPCRCGITDIKSMTSHMQRDSLLEYYSDHNFTKVALVHGETESKNEFARELQELIMKKNKTANVISVNKSTEILL